MRQLLRGYLVVVALLSISGCVTAFSAMEAPEVNVINIVPLPAEGVFEQRAQVDLRIINPNDFALHISGLSFKLDINDSRFARGVSNRSVTVPRLGEARTTVVLTTSVIDLLRQVMTLDEHRNLTYAIRGKLYLGGTRTHGLPFRHAGVLLQGPQ